MSTVTELINWQTKAERLLAERAFEAAHRYCMKILEVDSHYGEAYFLLAQIAAEYGNFGKAVEVFDRAITCHPDNPKYHAFRAKSLTPLYRPEEARTAARRAEQLNPTDALTLDTIGVVFSRTGYHEEAIPVFLQAVHNNPQSANMRYNLASSQQFVGDFDGAEISYRAAIELSPDFYRAHSALSQLKLQTPDKNNVVPLEALFTRIENDPDAALHIGHALAKEYEDLGKTETSFDWLNRGNSAKHAVTVWDASLEQMSFDAARKTARPSAGGGCQSNEPIFIVGLPRTGTTLVDRILSSHSQVFSAGELSNFALVLKRQVATPSNLVLDAETLNKGLLVDPAVLGAAYVDSTRPRTGHTSHFIDKMPLNFFYCGLINAALPNARILCLRRHPMDTCLSNFRQLFATSFSYYNYAYSLEDIARYYVMFDRLISHWRDHLPPDRFTEVRYEDLVANQEATSRRLIAHCGLNWEDRCLDFHKNVAPVATASSVQVRDPIYSSSVGRYKRYGNRLDAPARILESAGIDISG